MKNVLIIGGTSGIGWALANELANDDQIQNVYIVGRTLHTEVENPKINFFAHNLLMDNFNFSERFNDIDALFITIGAGRVAKFDNLSEKEINMEININYKAVATVLKQFYPRIQKSNDFKVAVISSIAGMINSPLFSVYGASKAAIMALIQSLNIELEKDGSNNRILDVRPGHIAGTRFANNKSIDTKPAQKVAVEIITAVQKKDQILIPGYEETYKAVIERNREDSHEFGINSYDYKIASNRLTEKPQIKIGYMSGTFDLFHIGHLNMLKKAKQYCDYLVVGVHKDASHKNKTVFIPLEERMEIVRSVRYVDEVIVSLPEDSDVREIIPYNYLFVGSDYKGTERFQRYEEQFSKLDDVEIVYFPYTKSTSSTQLRSAISQDNK
ncbi:SDR family NAD(P)-dependent oxidoreductase [Latilactobacillus curvatus]|uniref:SDR family NAD(P)-dependent oxidoreductase n=1 Tax=Latilactobacillus curvatus TaxID=28038 RepID=UPI0020C79653|nr:SDR family NAD(P)-dependent oxidoreductase [Latilactobacillus curvatus]MCP8862317.1 SDR family NAD(P)-dependent oxidoreductase [Latilactobacillus curvatus]